MDHQLMRPGSGGVDEFLVIGGHGLLGWVDIEDRVEGLVGRQASAIPLAPLEEQGQEAVFGLAIQESRAQSGAPSTNGLRVREPDRNRPCAREIRHDLEDHGLGVDMLMAVDVAWRYAEIAQSFELGVEFLSHLPGRHQAGGDTQPKLDAAEEPPTLAGQRRDPSARRKALRQSEM